LRNVNDDAGNRFKVIFVRLGAGGGVTAKPPVLPLLDIEPRSLRNDRSWEGSMSTLWTRLRLAVLVLLCAPGVFTVGLANAQSTSYQGLWWNAPAGSEAGWGINLAHQGDSIFATWFTYDTAGEGWWLSMTATKIGEGAYAGMVIETRGPAFSTVPFDPASVTRTPVGTGTLTFVGADHGTFTYNIKGVQQSKVITRQVFGRMPACTYAASPNLAATTNYQDLWWVPGGAESGWGINLAHQSDTIFATWFTYDADATPLWLSVTAPKVSPGIYRGDLIRTQGPAFSAVPFNPDLVKRTVVGNATFTFTSGNAGTFAYTVGGVTQTKTLTRQLFAPPAGTLCSPSRLVKNSFNLDAEDWATIWTGGFNWKPAGGEYSHPNYGAHLEAIDGGSQSPWYFIGSWWNYDGDLSSVYGGTLTYQLRWKANEVSECRLRGKHDYYYQDLWKPDVQIYGRNGIAIGYFFPYPPDTYENGLLYYNAWKEYSVPIAAQYGTIGGYKFGWLGYCEDRPNCYTAVTQDEIMRVLQDVDSIVIRGEYCLGSADRGMLDEVTLRAP
jgi:hypothetical protein